MLFPLVALALAAAAVGVGLVLGRLEFGGPLGVRAAEPTPASAQAFLTPRAVSDFDPLGDGRENGDQAALAVDGNPGTSWTTEGYNSPDLGGLKPGVGLILDLGHPVTVRGLALATTLPGWRFEIHGGSTGDGLAASRPLPDTGGHTVSVASEDGPTLALRPFRARYILIWITSLAPDGAGRFRASIAEVQVTGTDG